MCTLCIIKGHTLINTAFILTEFKPIKNEKWNMQNNTIPKQGLAYVFQINFTAWGCFLHEEGKQECLLHHHIRCMFLF